MKLLMFKAQTEHRTRVTLSLQKRSSQSSMLTSRTWSTVMYEAVTQFYFLIGTVVQLGRFNTRFLRREYALHYIIHWSLPRPILIFRRSDANFMAINTAICITSRPAGWSCCLLQATFPASFTLSQALRQRTTDRSPHELHLTTKFLWHPNWAQPPNVTFMDVVRWAGREAGRRTIYFSRSGYSMAEDLCDVQYFLETLRTLSGPSDPCLQLPQLACTVP